MTTLQEILARGEALGDVMEARKEAKEAAASARDTKETKWVEYGDALDNHTAAVSAFNAADVAHDNAIQIFRNYLASLQDELPI